MNFHSKILNYYRINKFKINVAKQVRINGTVSFVCEQPGTITIGDNSKINSGAKFNQIGGDSRTVIRTIGGGKIQIGKNVGISNSSIVAMNSITIEDNVKIGGSCKIYDNDFHSISFEKRMVKTESDIKSSPVIIKNGAFIGAHTIILKGVIIGTHSVIGAGSVVTTHVPDNEIWAGNPARFIRKIVD